jgi:rare lipoprotein A
VRTRPIGGFAALIAVLALVALAGPAQTRTPGTAAGSAPAAFTPLVIDGSRAAVATDSAPATPIDPAAVITVLVDPGVAAVPTRLQVPAVPAAPVTVVRKAAIRPAAIAKTSRSSVTSSSSSGSWRNAEYSWYGPGLYGNGTACGQTLTRSLVGVAHKSLPCGTRVTFRNPANGRTITVRVVDRGPYVSGRTWDLTSATCAALNACHTGRIQWRLP